MNLQTWLILLTIALLVLCGIVLAFRHGARQRFISGIPLTMMAALTIIPISIRPLLRWWSGKPIEDWPIMLGVAVTCFVGLCIIWLAGFFFGRWRASRRDGIVRSR